MTTPVAESPLSLSDSSVSSEWDELPAAELAPDLAPAEAKPDAPLPGTCETCGEPVIRQPGARGRTPKYHPDCRPVKATSATSTGTTGATGARRSTKVEAESVEALASIEGLVVKAAIMVSMVDRYDAFCVMVGWQQTKPNLLAVLRRYPGFRKEMLQLQSGGSLAALFISILMTLLPIAAHHGLIPGKKITQVLVNAPFMLHKISEKLSEGAAGLTSLMNEQLTAIKEAQKSATVTEATPSETTRVNGAPYGRP